ncbi:MAG TPA: hypothetical protein VF526_10755 [Solirubrobacteraceae bacterium]
MADDKRFRRVRRARGGACRSDVQGEVRAAGLDGDIDGQVHSPSQPRALPHGVTPL